MNTRGYQGKIRRSARVHTNAQGAENLTIGLTAFVDVPIVLRPPYVLISGVKGAASTKTIDVIAGRDMPLRLEIDSFDLEKFVGYRLEEIEKDKKYRIYITSNPDAEGTFNGFLNLKTNYPEKPTLHIRINGRIGT